MSRRVCTEFISTQKKDTFRYTIHVSLILYIKSNKWKEPYYRKRKGKERKKKADLFDKQ